MGFSTSKCMVQKLLEYRILQKQGFVLQRQPEDIRRRSQVRPQLSTHQAPCVNAPALSRRVGRQSPSTSIHKHGISLTREACNRIPRPISMIIIPWECLPPQVIALYLCIFCVLPMLTVTAWTVQLEVLPGLPDGVPTSSSESSSESTKPWNKSLLVAGRIKSLSGYITF